MLDRLRRLLGGDTTPATPVSAQATKVRAAVFDRSRNVVDVVGESHRQQALERIGGGRDANGVRDPDHVAGLLPERDNPVDPEAVAVQVDAMHVGYLSREDARAYRPVLDRLAAHGLYMACQATLSGGWDRGPSDRGSIGVRLHVGTPAALWAEMDTMLGPGEPMPAGSVASIPAPMPVGGAAPPEWAGKSVCFTGPSGFAFRGSQVGRGMQELLAVQHGMVVLPRVTKALDLLVIGFGQPQTGKTAKAALYGTVVIDEAAFWTRLGVALDPFEG